MADPLEDLPFRAIRNRCMDLSLQCYGQRMTKKQLIQMIREAENREETISSPLEEEEEEKPHHSPKRVVSPKREGGTLSERLGSSLDEFARDLEEFVSQIRTWYKFLLHG